MNPARWQQILDQQPHCHPRYGGAAHELCFTNLNLLVQSAQSMRAFLNQIALLDNKLMPGVSSEHWAQINALKTRAAQILNGEL